MGSRIKVNPDKLFYCFLEIVAPGDPEENPWILQKFPDSYSDEEVLHSVSNFTFPCSIPCSTVQHFSFVLTDIDSKWTFGFCRHAPNSQTALCILSSLPWHEVYYKVLNTIAEITQRSEAGDLNEFLKVLYNSKVPLPGSELTIVVENKTELQVTCPDHSHLPFIPDNRNLTEYFSAVDIHNMVVIFASMLNERRILITSSRLSRLSACVQAANLLIYPMHWQHIFIPVLPKNLIDYLSAPMPFLIGVPYPLFQKAKMTEIGDVVILYADKNKIETPFDDLESLPPSTVSNLKQRLKNPAAMLQDGVARAFLNALVELIGSYRDALKIREGEQISFDQDVFIQSRPGTIQPFLQKMLHLQIFQQFIEERLEMLNAGKGFSDIFENEVTLQMDKNSNKFKMQYKEWLTNMRKESGAFFKNVKSKANPAMKYAYKHMREKSKKAYKEMRSMFQEQQRDSEVPHTALQPYGGQSQPRSAPSSPTLSPKGKSNTSRSHKSYYQAERQSSVVSYVREREAALRRLTLSHTNDLKKPYDLLQVDEIGAEAQENEMSKEDEYSEELKLRRISVDLMGDLQDLIFKKYSFSEEVSNNGEQSESVEKPNFSSLPYMSSNAGPEVAMSNNKTSIYEVPPIPPPRSRHRVGHTTSISSINQSPEIPKQTNPEILNENEVPLIRLDSEETDVIFDPLLGGPPLPNTGTLLYQNIPVVLNNVVPPSPSCIQNNVYFEVPMRNGSFRENSVKKPAGSVASTVEKLNAISNLHNPSQAKFTPPNHQLNKDIALGNSYLSGVPTSATLNTSLVAPQIPLFYKPVAAPQYSPPISPNTYMNYSNNNNSITPILHQNASSLHSRKPTTLEQKEAILHQSLPNSPIHYGAFNTAPVPSTITPANIPASSHAIKPDPFSELLHWEKIPTTAKPVTGSGTSKDQWQTFE